MLLRSFRTSKEKRDQYPSSVRTFKDYLQVQMAGSRQIRQKQTIGKITKTGAGEEFESFDLKSMELDLEGGLMYPIVEELSPSNRLNNPEDSEE